MATPEEADVAAALSDVPEVCHGVHSGWRGPGPYTGSHSGCVMGPDYDAMAQAVMPIIAKARRDAFAAGVEASAAHVETLESGMHRLRYAAAIRALTPEEPRDG